MALNLTQSATAVGPNVPASFLALGGTAPYSYAIVPGGAGGMVNPTTGAYIGPPAVNAEASRAFDTIKVTDALNATATAAILVGSPLQLVCEIIQRELGIATGDIYLWNQKLPQPTDSRLYVAVSMLFAKPFGNTNRTVSVGGIAQSQAFVSMFGQVDVDVISRGPAARDRAPEVLLALGSNYAEFQMNANSFYIGRLPTGFRDLSSVDGAAIPYRYKISFNMQYTATKAKSVPFFDDFRNPSIFTNP